MALVDGPEEEQSGVETQSGGGVRRGRASPEAIAAERTRIEDGIVWVFELVPR